VEWLATEPEEPHFQVEGVLRTFFGNHGTRDDLVASMQTTAELARSMLDEMLGFVDEYLEDGGPLTMLERPMHDGAGARDAGPLEFHGRPMFPERLHVVALAIDVTTTLLKTLDDFFTESAAEVARWSSPTDDSITPATRERLEQIRTRRPSP